MLAKVKHSGLFCIIGEDRDFSKIDTWVEAVRIRECFWVIHDVVQTAKHHTIFGNDVLSNLGTIL
jgi:hypothetical protein